MRKFLAVVRYEYRKVVLRWAFLIGTFLFPVLAAGFGLVPALIFSMKSEPTRIAVVDPTGEILARLKEDLTADAVEKRARDAAGDNGAMKNMTASQQERMKQGAEHIASGFDIVDYQADGKSDDAIRDDLVKRTLRGDFDAYLIIPKDVSAPNAVYEFRSRKGGDFVAKDQLETALNEAVRSKRLSDANISEEQVRELTKNVKFDVKGLDISGQERNSDSLAAASFVIGLMIYITLMVYGQVIMGAVVEEKDTRIAEILFSSARPFELMFGKLVGVGLAGLTQLGIWIVTLGLLVGFLSTQSNSDVLALLPPISPLMIVCFLIYFLIGYFLYASIYALVGSMVTNVQEGGQFALPATLLLVMGYMFTFAVIRDPNSPLSFWLSIAPFFAPIIMPIRVLAETPPIWQIAVSMGINILAIVGLVWLAARVYRVGMLMYGKRATVPEVWKWIRQT
jgi:ABC-2 type transport system permease protein